MMDKPLSFEAYKNEIKKELLSTELDSYQADIVADYMTTVDFYGVTSHGVRTLSAHLDKIRSNSYNVNPSIKVIKETPSFAIFDGDNSIGMISAAECVKYAVEKARSTGMFTVFSRNNNTFGAAFYYTLLAAREGMICFAMSNSPAQMAPFGGKQKMLGTNPFSIAIPSERHAPFVVDMATSAVAKSKFKEYKENGEPLPIGWALDKDGNPTTDPDAAMEGFVLPMAGFKGYAMSMVIDSISGFLSGASFLDGVGRFYGGADGSMGVGFYFTVMCPKTIYGDDFYQKFDEYINHIRMSEGDSEKISVPGDDRAKAFEHNMKNGLNFTR